MKEKAKKIETNNISVIIKLTLFLILILWIFKK